MGSHGFKLYKWLSNSIDFVRRISELTNIESDLIFDKCSSKVLGLNWCSNQDRTVSAPCFLLNGPLTKRKILSFIVECFDPSGVFEPGDIHWETFDPKSMAQ